MPEIRGAPEAPRKAGLEAWGPEAWPESGLCRRPKPWLPPRVVAGALLLVPALRCVLRLFAENSGRARWIDVSAAFMTVLLGACLWWVAHRQAGSEGASLALGLLVLSPNALPVSPFAPAAALGVFAVLYTGVGVAHALQGPRRKWLPRILLMSSLCCFTAAVQWPACAAALGLATVAMLYLAEERRRLIPLLLLGWGLAAGVGAAIRKVLPQSSVLIGFPSVPTHVHGQAVGPQAASVFGAGVGAGCLLALLAALVLWGLARRSRYFGNSAPLLGALLLGLAGVATGEPSQAVYICMPLLLLFAAGVFADGLETRYRRLWTGLAVLCLAVQTTVLTAMRK